MTTRVKRDDRETWPTWEVTEIWEFRNKIKAPTKEDALDWIGMFDGNEDSNVRKTTAKKVVKED